MARFVSTSQQNISTTAGSPTAIVSGASNTSGIPADKYGILLSVLSSNKTLEGQQITLQLVKSGDAATSLLTSGDVPSKSSLELMQGNKIILTPGDVLQAFSEPTVSGMDVTVSYMIADQDTTIS